MMQSFLKEKMLRLLRWSQRYTKTDMVYIATGSFWVILGRAGVLIISFVTMAAFARWFPKEAYGTYRFIISALGIAGISALSGMNVALIKSIARNNEGTFIAAIKAKMKWSLIGSAGLAAFAGWYFLNNNIELAASFLASALFLPLWATTPISAIFWNAQKKFKEEFIYKIGPAFLVMLSLLPVIYFTESAFLIVFASLSTHALFEGIFLYKAVNKLKNRQCDGEAIEFGKSLTIMDIAATIGGELDSIVLWYFLGPVQVAVYSFSYFPVKTLTGNILPIHALALPKISEKNIKDIKKGLLRKFMLLFALSLPFTFIAIFATPFVYRMFFPNYMESVAYLQVLWIIGLLVPFQLLEAALISGMRKKELYVVRAGSSAVKIILLLLLSPFFGIWGVVAAILIMQFMRNAAIFYFFQKI